MAQHVVEGGQVPIPFQLRATRSGIPEHARLVVTARIEFDGRLMWITDTAHLVDAQSNTDGITIPVEQVAASG
jgi:putative lipoprotein